MFYTKDKNNENFINDLKSILDKNDEVITTLSNSVAIIKYYLKDISWVGFYIRKDNYLYLGPFQGQPACTKIMFGKGVCGESFKLKETILVSDVTKHANHIFCDENTKSEIVLPIIKNNEVYAVLDIDSYMLDRFKEADKDTLALAVKIIEEKI